MDNAARRARAAKALAAYRGSDDMSRGENLQDLLGDLQHWALWQGLGFVQALNQATFNFRNEAYGPNADVGDLPVCISMREAELIETLAQEGLDDRAQFYRDYPCELEQEFDEWYRSRQGAVDSLDGAIRNVSAEDLNEVDE